jgi:metal-dependent amidase/aminoacylase/carboxypeptidase family protein
MKDYKEYEEMEEEENIRYDTNATKVEIEIKGNRIYAILDSGAGKNVISEKVRVKLQIRGMKPSRKSFTIANGKKIASKGIVNTRIKFDGVFIPTQFEVIESTEEDIILGTKWLDEKGNIDYIKGELTVYYDNQELVKPIIYKRLIQKGEEQNENMEENNGNNEEEELNN